MQKAFDNEKRVLFKYNKKSRASFRFAIGIRIFSKESGNGRRKNISHDTVTEI